MQTIVTNYGTITCARQMELSPKGLPVSCTAIKPCPLETPLGTLIPQHTTDDLRKKEVQPVTFHADGTLKALPLETQTVVTTPAGDIPAELITFHKNGNINRIFPLNGKLSGYWAQEDEKGLAKPITLETPAGSIFASLISVCFHADGSLRSLTLWPGETVKAMAPTGVVSVRTGISFSPDGTIRSLEPAAPTLITTPAGDITAYDPDAVGVNGDANSLTFHDDGTVARVTTTLTRIKTVQQDGRVITFTPEYRDSLCGDEDREIMPMRVEFEGRTARIWPLPDAAPVSMDMDQTTLFAEPYLPGFEIVGIALKCGV